MATQQTTRGNGRSEKHYDFTPIDHDSNALEPDASAGEYPSVVDDVKVMKTSADGFPMICLEWKLESTNTDSEAAEKSVGATVSDFIAFFPDGDRRGNFPKRRFKQLRDLFDLPEDILPTRLESKDDFQPLVDALKGQEATIWITMRTDKTSGEERANVNYTAPRTAMSAMPAGDEGEEEQEEDKPARRPAARSAPAKKPAARRR
jgi:hypothetical protein